jgi:thymidylate synthase
MESVLRETILHPRLVLNPEKTNFYEMTIDDFTVENYNPIKPQLKLELGI